MSFKLRITLIFALALMICGCGGGGSSGSADVTTTTTTTTTAATTTTTTSVTTTSTTTTTTAGTGTVTSSTTTTTLQPANYLYLVNDNISFFDGYLTTPYTLAQFQNAPGITVKWPMYDIAALAFTLADGGNFTVSPGQTLTAAASFEDTAGGSQGVVRLYVDGVTLAKQGSSIVMTVPPTATAWAYGVATDGGGAAIQNLSSSVSNATGTLSIDGSTASQIVFGAALNSAINGTGSTSSMRGTYKVTLVVTNLQLRKVDQTPFSTYTITVPTSLAAGANVRSITGLGLQGYITLTSW